jgi:hypothetical protein
MRKVNRSITQTDTKRPTFDNPPFLPSFFAFKFGAKHPLFLAKLSPTKL